MQTPESMAREFHAALHVHAGWMPATPTTIIPPYLHELRQALLDEEVDELREAVAAADVVKIADALADITYVVGGTAVTYGIPLDAVLAEVHKSNMTKTNTPDEAKLVKGPGYEPPHIAEVLGLQRKKGLWRGTSLRRATGAASRAAVPPGMSGSLLGLVSGYGNAGSVTSTRTNRRRKYRQ